VLGCLAGFNNFNEGFDFWINQFSRFQWLFNKRLLLICIGLVLFGRTRLYALFFVKQLNVASENIILEFRISRIIEHALLVPNSLFASRHADAWAVLRLQAHSCGMSVCVIWYC
jgi:hypothetical protein